MSDFLANVLSRHTQSENIVLPKGKSIFESQLPLSSPVKINSPVEGESILPEITSPPPENSVIIPRLKQIGTDQPTEDSPRQEDNKVIHKSSEKPFNVSHPEPLPKLEKKATKVEERIIENIKLKTEKILIKKAASQNDKEQPRPQIPDKRILNKLQNKLQEPKSIQQSSSPASHQDDTQPTQPVYLDRVIVKTAKGTKPPHLSNFNMNTHIENAIKLNSINDTSIVNQKPTVKIHIGRIDIRAVKPSTPRAPKVQKANKPDISLQQFLNKREGK